MRPDYNRSVREIKRVKEVRNSRSVERNVRVTWRRDWIREIVTAAVTDGADLPVSLDEFVDRDMVRVAVRDVTTRRVL